VILRNAAFPVCRSISVPRTASAATVSPSWQIRSQIRVSKEWKPQIRVFEEWKVGFSMSESQIRSVTPD
jgi:hypothetical protein